MATQTKLRVPELGVGPVVRPELIRGLEAGRSRRLTLVSAPTGFGKTSTLTAWAAASPARFAWLSLDEGDDQPARFWTYVVGAIKCVAPELPDTATRRLRAPGVSIADEVLPAMVNEVTVITRPVVLVVDDYHLISADEIHTGMSYLVERLGPEIHVVLAGQSDPPLRLGRLRARGELSEFRAEHLRFTDEEAAVLLNDTHGLCLTPAQVIGLQQRTEGWVAGLNLVALSLRDTDDRGEFLAGMPVDDRFLVDYLWEEVVIRQPEATREFLMRTAVLESLTGSLCDAVSERHDSAELLLELERSNVFVVALDAERRWFRYHRLFRAMLRRQLERRHPERVADLHRRASAWFADRGDLGGAIEQALAAGDVHFAADTLQRNWLALYSSGQADAAVAWIDGLPPDTMADYPELALGRAAMARAMGQIDEAEPWLALVERAAEDARSDTQRRELLAGVARQRSMCRLGDADVDDAVRLARLAVELRPDGSPEAPSDSYFLAICLFWTGSTAESEQRLREYLAATPPGERDVHRVFAMAVLAEAHAVRGELDVAERLAQESLSTTEARGLGEHPPTEQAYVAHGILLLARGDVEQAEDRLEHAVTLARRGGDRIEIAHALLWLGRCRARAGDETGAADALRAARGQLAGARVAGLVALTNGIEQEVRRLPASPAEAAVDGGALSAAELRVLELLPSHLTYREIAGRLYLSLNTVRTHSQRIRRKLGASTRGEAVSAARRLELL